MRLTITDGEGVVLAMHTLDGAACGALLGLLDDRPCEDAAAEEAAQEALDDLAAAARRDA